MLFAVLSIVILHHAVPARCILRFNDPKTTLLLETTTNVSFKVNETLTNAVFSFSSSDPSVVQVIAQSVLLGDAINPGGINGTVTLSAIKIGFADLGWQIASCENGTGAAGNTDSDVCGSGVHELCVVHGRDAFATSFGILIGVLVALNNVNVGCQLDLNVVAVQIKRPVAPAVGMLCQFLFMPLVSYGLGILLLGDAVSRLGLFTIGCCPGGVYSNFYTLLLQGDLDLSVTMTFLSTLGALGTMPVWMYTLGKTITGPMVTGVPFAHIILSLVALALPLGIGLLIRHKRPKWAEASKVIVKPFSVAILLVAMALGIYSYRHLLTLVRTAQIGAAGSLVILGFTFGAIMAWIAKLNRKQIIAVSIETAIQNTPLALFILTLSLPQPSSDLALVPVVMLVSVSGVVLLLCFAVLTVYQIHRKNEVLAIQQEWELSNVDS